MFPGYKTLVCLKRETLKEIQKLFFKRYIHGKLKTPTSEQRTYTAYDGAAINLMFCPHTS